MHPIRKLIHRKSANSLRGNRGLSTAELVGIIVIVGILGALGGTYVNGLINQANTNAGQQNATTLTSVAGSILAAGGTLNSKDYSNGDGSDGSLDIGAGAGTAATDTAQCILALNAGVTVTDANKNPVLYKMSPPIANGGSYTMSVTTATATTPASLAFSYVKGSAP